VENIGSLRFFSIAHERFHLAVARSHPLAGKDEIAIDDLRTEKIIAFKRQNQSTQSATSRRSSRSIS